MIKNKVSNDSQNSASQKKVRLLLMVLCFLVYILSIFFLRSWLFPALMLSGISVSYYASLFTKKTGDYMVIGGLSIILLGIVSLPLKEFADNRQMMTAYYKSSGIVSGTICNNDHTQSISIDSKEKHLQGIRSNLKLGDSVIIIYGKEYEGRVSVWNPDSHTFEYFKYPILFINNIEFGNDYYYYAKLRPDLALKNFGLNKLTMNNNSLYYRNINDSIDSQSHKCPDSLQTQHYREMLDTSGYAFYFHGEIVPKEQVFYEIPKAREYYERYCGKAE